MSYKHTAVRRNEVRGAIQPHDITAGVPLTADMCYIIGVLVNAEIAARKAGRGTLPVTSEALCTPCLERIERLMHAAIADISVLRDRG